MVDYSKWKDIEVSDDEDDTHPNVDTASLFRWRHQARVERMTQLEKEKEELNKAKAAQERKIADIKRKLNEVKNTGVMDMGSLTVELSEMEKQQEAFRKKEEELKKKDSLAPWNVDTISKEGFTKTVINKPPPRKVDDMTEEEKEARQREYIKNNEKLLKKFGMLKKFDDSKAFLMENPHLACEETANYLVIWCINLEMEEKTELMEHVAHQTICMQYILELSKQLDVDPRACVSSFFTRIQTADKQYVDAFNDELKAFKQRVTTRAKEKLDAALKEYEEEERQKRLGPGGLDPEEVFESLPKELQKCFETQNIPLLQEVIANMAEGEARYHMKRCVDSGLWVPDAKAAAAMATATGGSSDDGESTTAEAASSSSSAEDTTTTSK